MAEVSEKVSHGEKVEGKYLTYYLAQEKLSMKSIYGNVTELLLAGVDTVSILQCARAECFFHEWDSISFLSVASLCIWALVKIDLWDGKTGIGTEWCITQSRAVQTGLCALTARSGLSVPGQEWCQPFNDSYSGISSWLTMPQNAYPCRRAGIYRYIFTVPRPTSGMREIAFDVFKEYLCACSECLMGLKAPHLFFLEMLLGPEDGYSSHALVTHFFLHCWMHCALNST